MIKIYNTFSKQLEEFAPLHKKKVGMYTCGPTVYDYDHIGHAWNYVNADLLRRVLEYAGYKVHHVMNITDVGHLTSDADSGEDKLQKAARERGQTAWDIAEFYTNVFFENRKKMNLLDPRDITKATDHVKEMIALVQNLLDKGIAYETSDGIYFNTEEFPAYGKLSGNTLENLKEGARVEINPEKKNPTDFALWKFSPEGEQRDMEWTAFGRKGFPGWHIECSAMSMRYLGESFDVHTGGEDNIFPHHECEIAQSESATGKPFVKYWFHTRFLTVMGQKMSKSLKNFFTIADLEKEGFDALDLRYLFMTAHYRSQLNFTWEALTAARTARGRLLDFLSGIKKRGRVSAKYGELFEREIYNDLAMPKAMAVVWELVKDKEIPDQDKKATLFAFDAVLGLRLKGTSALATTKSIPKEVMALVKEREELRKNKDFMSADMLRDKIQGLGYELEDIDGGTKVVKK